MGSNSSSTMLGRNILLLVFYLALAGVNSADDNCSNSDNCNAEAGSRVKIICENDTPEVKCTCEGNVTNSELFTMPCEPDINGLLTVDITFNNMDAAMCEDLCKADSKPDACKFFKLVEMNKYQGGDRVCYLMSGDQCDDTSVTTCDSGHCSSGGIACDGTDPTTPPPAADKVDCQTSPLLKHNDDGEHLRWRCNDGPDQVDIYDAQFYADAVTPKSVPPGTVCMATNKCQKFGYPIGQEHANYFLSYKCAAKQDDPTQFIWQTNRDDNGTFDVNALEDFAKPAGAGNVTVLKEAECRVDDLELDETSYTQDGLLISCTDSQVTYKDGKPYVSAPNTCLMTCEFFNVLTFFPGRKNPDVNGERVWLFKMENDLTLDGTDGGATEGEINTEDPSNPTHPKKLLSCW